MSLNIYEGFSTYSKLVTFFSTVAKGVKMNDRLMWKRSLVCMWIFFSAQDGGVGVGVVRVDEWK